MSFEEQLRASLSDDEPTIEAQQESYVDNHEMTRQTQQDSQAVYETDKRWGQHWKTPEDIYNSLVYEEKHNKPLITALQQRNIKDMEGLTHFLKKFDEYENPKSERNIFYNAMREVLSNPSTAEKMEQVLKEASDAEISQKWGNLPDEVIQRLKTADELERRENEREWNDTLKYYKGVVTQEVQKISDLCARYGIEPNISDFLNYYKNTGNSVNNIYDHFISLHIDEINKSVQQRASVNTLKNISHSAKSAIPTSSGDKKTLSSSSGKIRSIDDLRKQMLEALK